MPTLDRPWDRADFDSAYDLHGEPDGHPNTRRGVRLGYHRAAIMPTLDRRWTALVDRLGIDGTTRVAVIGAGFAWGCECLLTASGCTAIGTDISPWIQAEKNNTEEAELRERIEAVGLDSSAGRGAELLFRYRDGRRDFSPRAQTRVEDEGLTDASSRARLRQASAVADWTYAISEDVLPCLSDAGVLRLAANMDRMNPTISVIHTVTEFEPVDPAFPQNATQDPGYNWKTREQWRELFDANGFENHQLIGARIRSEFF